MVLRVSKLTEFYIFYIPLRGPIEAFQVSKIGREEMKLSPQLSLPEAKNWLCKAQYSSCCEWVCILDVCVVVCVCGELHPNLSWITFAVGVYRMVG